MSGQCNDSLRVCNVEMKKLLLGLKWGTFLRMYRLQPIASSILNDFFSKMVKLDEKECLDPRMSDFE